MDPQGQTVVDADDGDGGFGDAAGWGDTDFGNEENLEPGGGLLEAPRKVEKIRVTYSKASKQVWLVVFHITG